MDAAVLHGARRRGVRRGAGRFSAVSVLPLPVRITLAGAIGVLVMNVAPIHAPEHIRRRHLPARRQPRAALLVGLALGFVLQIAFAAPLVAGELIGVSMRSLRQPDRSPAHGTSTPALGNFLSILLTLLFLSVDGHLVLVDLVVRSYGGAAAGAAWLAPGRP